MPPAEHMHMQVRHRFAAVLAVVDHDAKATFEVELLSDHSGGDQQMPKKGGILCLRFGNARNDFFRDDQYMCRRLRINIVDRDTAIVFKFNLGGNLARDNFFEQCLHRKHCRRNFGTKRV